MKIPVEEHINTKSSLYREWLRAGHRATIKYGIYCSTWYLRNDNEIIYEIWYQIGEHRFDSLKDLKTAMKNKAFL